MKFITQIAYAAALTAVLTSCGSGSRFVIEGTVDEEVPDGTLVYLVDPHNPYEAVDSTTTKKGHYRFKGEVEEPWLAMLASEGIAVQCIVEPGTITVDSDSIGGTPLNKRLQITAGTIKHNLSGIESQLRTLMPLYQTAADATERAEVERTIDSLESEGNKIILAACGSMYEENRDNLLGRMAMESIAQIRDFSYAELDSIVNEAAPIVAESEVVQMKLEQLRRVDQTSVGKHYTDIVGVDGKLSDLIDGKVALVDFYASWCAPCRAAIKDHLVPLWKKYKDKGLVIVGLNVWERGNAAARKASHEKVMADLGITYPQLVDSTLVATETYGVSGIPQILLIGRDGTILARDLRGSDVEEAVIQALRK